MHPRSASSQNNISGSWSRLRRVKTGTMETKATFSRSYKCKDTHGLSSFIHLNAHSGEISLDSLNILCFCTTRTLHFLSLTPRGWGPGRGSLSQGLPNPKPPELCLIISLTNNTYRPRQHLLSTTSSCRCGRKALSHFLYDTVIVLLLMRAEEAIPPIPSSCSLLPGRDV